MEQENFLHDEELRDLEEITNTAESGEVIVVNGVWGFGKTKLIEKFKEKRNEQCLSINLWNSGFEKNVLYYFYKEISENENKEKNTFLKFYRWNIITVPIWFVISTFLLVNYFLPLLHKIISDNNSCIYIILLLIGIGVLTVVLYMIGYYIKRNIAKYIVFKKDFNSFFHEYFVSEIIKLAKKQNIQYVIVEDVDRLQRETIRELTTVIDSLKQNQEIKFKFIVSFNALKLLVPDEKDKQPEYYFDKVENHRVNMGGVVEKSQKLFYSQLGHHPEIKNHNNFDRKVLGESFQYFENVISLRFIEKFVTWYERQRGMENNRDKHPANMFVDFYLQQKQGMTEDEFRYRNEILFNDFIIEKEHEVVNGGIIEKLNEMVGQNELQICSEENEDVIYKLEITDVLKNYFFPKLPQNAVLYNYSRFINMISINFQYFQNINLYKVKQIKSIKTIEELNGLIEAVSDSKILTLLSNCFNGERIEIFEKYILKQKELIQKVVKIIAPFDLYFNANIRIKNSDELFFTISEKLLNEFLENGEWKFDGRSVEFLNPNGKQEIIMSQISNELMELINKQGLNYSDNLDVIKWYVFFCLHETEILLSNKYNDVLGSPQNIFFNVFLRLKEEIDNDLKH